MKKAVCLPTIVGLAVMLYHTMVSAGTEPRGAADADGCAGGPMLVQPTSDGVGFIVITCTYTLLVALFLLLSP